MDRLLATKSEGVGLIVRAIIPRFPTYVITIHQRHRQTDRRTDGRHAIPRPRICTKVHCAVKTLHLWSLYLCFIGVQCWLSQNQSVTWRTSRQILTGHVKPEVNTQAILSSLKPKGSVTVSQNNYPIPLLSVAMGDLGQKLHWWSFPPLPVMV